MGLTLNLANGQTHTRTLDIAPGFPGADLSDAQHLARFDDGLAYAPKPLPAARRAACLVALERLGEVDDVRWRVRLLVAQPPAPGSAARLRCGPSLAHADPGK